jgi:Bacterial regulatory helix-turn-helix protein, lysR family
MIDNKLSAGMAARSRMLAIDLQHLRYAVAARVQGSFRRAAESLLIQQSTLSRCIRQLEHSIGMTIFERSSGGVRATDAGRDFLHLARSILEQVDSLVTRAHRSGRGEAGRLTIGFYTSLTAGNLRATLADYARRFPAGSNRNGGRDHSGRVGGIEQNQHSCCPFTPRLEAWRPGIGDGNSLKIIIKSIGYRLAKRETATLHCLQY